MTHEALTEVELETTLGAVYRLPDIYESSIVDVLEQLRGHKDWLSISNVSRACLIVPVRIVSIVRVGGEERWRR